MRQWHTCYACAASPLLLAADQFQLHAVHRTSDTQSTWCGHHEANMC
jgi:hypothetical protein